MKKHALLPILLAALLLFCGCTGGNTNIEPSELADQLVKKFHVTKVGALSEDLIGERYGLDTGELEAWDVREGESDEEVTLIAVVKVKEQSDAAQAEQSLREGALAFAERFASASAEQYELARSPETAQSGPYVFLAAGKDAAKMVEEFERLTR